MTDLLNLETPAYIGQNLKNVTYSSYNIFYTCPCNEGNVASIICNPSHSSLHRYLFSTPIFLTDI